MDYRFKKEAKNDLDEIYKYYEEKSPGKSREFVRNVREKLKYIAEKPFAYSEDKDTGVRRAPIKKFKHYLYYMIRSPYVVVIAIWHIARLPFSEERRDEDDDFLN